MAKNMRGKIFQSMQDSDRLVVEFLYLDSKGNQTKRVVSPIRFLPNGRFLGLCLCREEPRQFYMERCERLEVKPAENYLMPVAM
jgi:predicted DNA-binding transcriptional regulator YafY